MHILIAEDEKPIQSSLQKNFNAVGHIVNSVYDGDAAVKEAMNNRFDVIILDWRMPKLTGYEVCTQLRNNGNNTPIVLLTALNDIKNKVEALEIGADDYITKPFSFSELNARIKAVIRRYNRPSATLSFDNFTLNLVDRTLSSQKEVIKLSDKEFELLRFFILNKGIILDRDTICIKVWGTKFDRMTNIVEATIKNLRKKLNVGTDKNLIKSVYGEGYILIED